MTNGEVSSIFYQIIYLAGSFQGRQFGIDEGGGADAQCDDGRNVDDDDESGACRDRVKCGNYLLSLKDNSQSLRGVLLQFD